MKTNRRVLTGTALLSAMVTMGVGAACSSTPAAVVSGPSYDEEGRLLRPRGFRSWVAVGSSLGVTYRENAEGSGPGSFKNVYLEPSAYAEYRRTGEFPEGTMLALAVHETREPAPDAPLARGGFFQGTLRALEFAVKDSAQLEDGWGYFDFGGGGALKERAEAFAKARCFDCHAEHAAEDNVFVQFYPVLRDGADDE